MDYVAELVERKNSRIRFQPFFEEENDFDVIFLGSSHMKLGVSPIYLWKNYGIVSYDFGGSGYRIPTSYWTMMNVLDYTHPKLIVLDCWAIESEKKIPNDHENLHDVLDAFGISRTKMNTIMDLFGEDPMYRLEMMWEYSIYHARWHDLTKEDFEYDCMKNKGATEESRVATPESVFQVSADDMYQGENYGTEYLRLIIQECKKRNIELLLTYLPFPASVEEQQGANRAALIASEYGIQYINMLNMNIVDYETDCLDSASHLNPSGASKVSEYLGAYITEHYDIKDHRGDPAFSSWNDDYKEYLKFKQENLIAEDSMGNYLMLASDKDYDKELFVRNKKIYDSDFYRHMLVNMGIDEFIIDLRPDYISIIDETAIDKKMMDMQPIAQEEADLQIMVIDKDTSEVVDDVAFSFDTSEDVPDDYIVSTGAYR